MWKDIPGYEWKYQASTFWNIKSLNYRRMKIEKKMSLNVLKTNYIVVSFWREKWCTKRVHRLVAATFLGEENWLEVNHKNWNPSDNRIWNLEYCTRSENILHSFRELWRKSHFKWKFWKKNSLSCPILQFSKNWEFIKKWDSLMDAQRELSIAKQSISRCCKWRLKSAWWYIWCFI